MRSLLLTATGLVLVATARGQVTERVSVATGGAQANFGGDLTYNAAISPDGRYVAFISFSTNLDAADTNGKSDVYLRDRQNGTTTWVSPTDQGLPGNANSGGLGISVSAEGRYIAFHSTATNLVAGDTNGVWDVFVRDRQSGTTERVSVATGGAQADADSTSCQISANGRFVAFTSSAQNLVPVDSNGHPDAFVRDLILGTTELVSVTSGGLQANFGGASGSLSADGRYAAFMSSATNLVPGDTNDMQDVFLRDLVLGTTERVSVATGGAQANFGSTYYASVSDDGRSIAFGSDASDLVPGDTNDVTDIFVHDRTSAITERVSVGTGGTQTGPNIGSDIPAISGDGRFVTFRSYSTHLVPGDTNQMGDVFVHDRHASGFTSLCEPGIAGVSACPCSNPPSGPGKGCDNSAATGGAALAAAGAAYLSFDGLVLTTSGELPTATSIVVQGNVDVPNGAVFGQGVRCVGGMVLLLYVKVANAGSITAPDVATGDPSLSARSAQLGDPIAAGESRYYSVYYRDPFVLGGCPAMNTFNATQAGRVVWSL